jgi:hypothetical protein
VTIAVLKERFKGLVLTITHNFVTLAAAFHTIRQSRGSNKDCEGLRDFF